MRANYLTYLVIGCIALQLANFRVEAIAVAETLKKSAKLVADVADKTATVEKTGGFRQHALHTGVDIALEKGVQALGVAFPATRLAAPIALRLAKPVVNSVHGTINNMFNKDETDQKPEVEGSKEDASEEENKGILSKVKSLVTGNKQDESEGVQAEKVEEESTEEKKGLLAKMKDMVSGDDVKEPEKVDADAANLPKEKEELPSKDKASTTGDKDAETVKSAVASPTEKKQGVLSKMKDLVTGDKDHDSNKQSEATIPPSKSEVEPENKSKKEGILTKVKSLVTGNEDTETKEPKTELKSTAQPDDKKLDKPKEGLLDKVKSLVKTEKKDVPQKAGEVLPVDGKKEAAPEENKGVLSKVKNIIGTKKQDNDEKDASEAVSPKPAEAGKVDAHKEGPLSKVKNLIKGDKVAETPAEAKTGPTSKK